MTEEPRSADSAPSDHPTLLVMAQALCRRVSRLLLGVAYDSSRGPMARSRANTTANKSTWFSSP